MAQSAFSFHCMICFEEFDPEERYPVVLPCGHTYVCFVCSERLDKCMECRTPLVWNIPRTDLTNAPMNHRNNASSSNRSSWSSSARARSGGQQQQPQQIPRTIGKRLPLPKNVVLLSLIEATELATEDANKNDGGASTVASADDCSCANSTTSAIPLSDENEEQKIKLGTSVAVGAAGTYAVAASGGLPIISSRLGTVTSGPTIPPAFNSHGDVAEDHDSLGSGDEMEGPRQNGDNEELEALVNLFNSDKKSNNVAADEEVKENRVKEPARAHLSCGDRVQVVSLNRGWAKLARGYGYVRADHNQLVKVGGSIDRACKLEAMIRTISLQRKQLRIEQSKVDNLFIRLMNDLQISLMNDEDLTVIVADTFSPIKSNFEKEGRQESSASSGRDSSIYSDKTGSLNQNQPFKTHEPGYYGSPTTPTRAHAFGSTTDEMMRNAPDVPAALFPSRSHPSPSAMREGARAWREQHGRSPSRGIDFKTGLSGHMALLSTHAHAHEYLGVSGWSSRSFLGMSNHTGLTMTRAKEIYNAIMPVMPSLPLLGNPPTNDVTSSSTESRTGAV